MPWSESQKKENIFYMITDYFRQTRPEFCAVQAVVFDVFMFAVEFGEFGGCRHFYCFL